MGWSLQITGSNSIIGCQRKSDAFALRVRVVDRGVRQDYARCY